jgi:hypothetical protein
MFLKPFNGAVASLSIRPPIFPVIPVIVLITKSNPIFIAPIAATLNPIVLRTLSLISSNLFLFPSAFALSASIP